MKHILAKVDAVDGKFYSRDTDGTIAKLKAGSEIYIGNTVYGDLKNLPESSIQIFIISSSNIFTISNGSEQLFDSSMGDEYSHEEAIINLASIESFITRSNAEADSQCDFIETSSGELENISGDDHSYFAISNSIEINIEANLREDYLDFYETLEENSEDKHYEDEFTSLEASLEASLELKVQEKLTFKDLDFPDLDDMLDDIDDNIVKDEDFAKLDFSDMLNNKDDDYTLDFNILPVDEEREAIISKLQKENSSDLYLNNEQITLDIEEQLDSAYLI